MSKKKMPLTCSLTQERKNEIAHIIASQQVFKAFKLMRSGEYMRKLGQEAADLDLPVEDLHQFILDVLPKYLGTMFGWDACSITGTSR